MQITITHCRYAPKWDSLQTVIREVVNDPDGTIIRIARKDNGCNYRSPGKYSLSFLSGNKTQSLPIELNIVAVGCSIGVEGQNYRQKRFH